MPLPPAMAASQVLQPPEKPDEFQVLHDAALTIMGLIEVPPQSRLALQETRQPTTQSSVELPPTRDAHSQRSWKDKSWEYELAEVRNMTDSLSSVYREIAIDDLRDAQTPHERRIALIKAAITSDERGPVKNNSAFSLLKASNERVAASIKAKAKAAISSSSSRKRKAESTLEEDIALYKQDLGHIDLDGMHVDMNCDQVRKRINQVLDDAIMKKGEFCKAIGLSNNSLNAFLQKRGPMDGMKSEVYTSAWTWFKQRELAGLKMPDVKKRQQAEAAAAAAASSSGPTGAGHAAKKSKTTASSDAMPDLSQIHLAGEETDSVLVFDSADEIRKKISAHLKTPGLTQAQFCRDLYAQIKAPTCKGIQSKQLNDFRGKKGPLAGCTSSVYYAAYVYFEKLRIARGKPKNAHRLEMERIYPGEGVDREDDGRHG